ncbi:hypothetical protein IFT48_13415 [Pseudomonas fluorescens]|uniref:hypothetical protein n=2 Tax=Pseudomonas fluorescens TaxID=294 RepID=UPI00190660D9|nr:hypothetical protein [Pseudomonas fluorescens]MBD8090995.1 hypothetical protein [Pseudomonas fluorescens]MBD8717473.1 hypothetical protein [Pseudomonas fluorescens]
MTDSYGLMFQNADDNRVILDSEFVRLSILYSGTYAPNGANGIAQVYFPSPITTQEQPFVFIRPDPANGPISMLPALFGSPGNWTGFGIGKYSLYNINPAGKWYVAGFGAKPISEYGLRLSSSLGVTLFDSGTPSALFVRSTNTWTYTGWDYDAQGVTRCYFKAPFVLGGGEYVLINNLEMPLCGSEFRPRQLYFVWDYPNNQIIAITLGVGNTTYLGIPLMIGKMVM